MSKILETLKSYNITPEPVADKYRMPCLFHTDHDPSMVIYPASDSFYCFGCGKWGTAIDIVMLKENMPFYEAAELVYGKGYSLRKLREPTQDSFDTDTKYSLNIIAKHIHKLKVITPKALETIMRIATLEKIGPDNLFAILKEVKNL